MLQTRKCKISDYERFESNCLYDILLAFQVDFMTKLMSFMICKVIVS